MVERVVAITTLGILISLVLPAAQAAREGRVSAPTFQELMDPKLFPDAQFGMRIESAVSDRSQIEVKTTGSMVRIDSSKGEISFEQRIGHPRPIASLKFESPMAGARIVQQTEGFVLIECGIPKIRIRINGDSLCMIQAKTPLKIPIRKYFDTGWTASFKSADHLLADEWGGMGLYCSIPDLNVNFDPYSKNDIAVYNLPADAVLWIGICPPKPYDWEKSFSDQVFWHWSDKSSYPPDRDLRSWRRRANIALLQGEIMLWKDWNLAFEPRLGVQEFDRIRETFHALGMRFIVYTSPYYFLKGTADESKAINNFANFKGGWPQCVDTSTGKNMGLFIAEIEKVMTKLRPDGLYFDGQYLENPAALYALARESRRIVGEHGLLEWHSTAALGYSNCYLPQADAYVDYILRGEGNEALYTDFNYMRFFVSGYNISNSIGVLCNNGPIPLTTELLATMRKANIRTHFIGKFEDRFDDYRSSLTPELREDVEREAFIRQASIPEAVAELRRKGKATAVQPVVPIP